jgi:hypothetical protein
MGKMGAYCANYVCTAENECGNDTTKEFDCMNCKNWYPAYDCPANDDIAKYREITGIRITRRILKK